MKECKLSLIRVSPDGKNWGMGVVVHGSYIITAAHCVFAKFEHIHQLGHFPAYVKSMSGETSTRGVVRCLDPISDIAVIGDPDPNDGWPGEWYQEFARLIALCKPAKVAWDTQKAPSFRTANRVFIHTHEGLIVCGTICSAEVRGSFGVELKKGKIKGGTSGSGVFDTRGRVLGIVSTSPEGKTLSNIAECAYIPGALPGWASNLIRREQNGKWP